MPKIKGLKLSQTEVSQRINLKELFGQTLVNQSDLTQEIAQAIIDRIIARTESGQSVDGGKLKKYSKDYIASPEFKAFNKSAEHVDMTLTGQMLGTLDVLDTRGDTIRIGWEDAVENAKAYNHNVGDTVTKRAFFGITDDELQDIKSEFEDKLDDKLQSPRRSTVAKLLELLTNAVVDVAEG